MAWRRYELTDKEWLIIEPLLPNKPRSVPRVDDRRVLNGILWRFRSGAPWAEIPERYGPSTTCYNRFVRWRKAGVWDRLLAAASVGFNGELVMIDSTCMRVGCSAYTLLEWVKKAEVNSGVRAGVPTELADRLKALERENRELRQANEILRKASAYFAQAELDRPFKR